MKSDAIVGALKAAAGEGIDVDDALDQLGDLVELAHAKPVKKDLSQVEVILSQVPLGFAGKTCVVGWDTCAKCNKLVKTCACPAGPTEPPYIHKFRQGDTGVLPTSVSSRAEEVANIHDLNLIEPSVGPTCSTCSTQVTTDNADQNDDKSWDCFDCQEATG